MDAGGGEQAFAGLVQLPAEFQGLFAVRQAGAGQYQLADPRPVGPSEQVLAVAIEAGMGQVDADVDKLHGDISKMNAGSIAEPTRRN